MIRLLVRQLSSTRLRLPPASTLNGSCRCGNISFKAEFTFPVSTFQPRSCDCDFCVARNATYASDPKGSLQFNVSNKEALKLTKQDPDSNAEFLICKSCDTLAGVIFKPAGEAKHIGTINAALLDPATFGTKMVVSPKLLNADQKIQRWKDNWFHNVEVH